MLQMVVTVHDQQWPQITITITRDSYAHGKVAVQDKKQYDLAYVKLEEMLHNQARPMVQELLDRHQRNRVGVPTGQ
jgi:hypothetical protein